MEEKFTATESSLEKFIRYEMDEERSPATVEKYTRDIKLFIDFLGNDKSITRDRVIAYKKELLSKYEVSSVNSMLAALNQFLKFIGAHELKVKRIKVQRAAFREAERDLTEADYKKLVQKAYGEGNVRIALIMETICATGIRVSELQHFTVSSVRAGRIQINNKGKVRSILIPDQLKKKILHYISKKKIKSGSVFVTSGGKPVDRSNIWREMKKLGADINILEKKIYPHNLRHLFSKLYYEMFKDMAALADILGHTSVETTRIYTITTGEEYRHRLEKLHLIS